MLDRDLLLFSDQQALERIWTTDFVPPVAGTATIG